MIDIWNVEFSCRKYLNILVIIAESPGIACSAESSNATGSFTLSALGFLWAHYLTTTVMSAYVQQYRLSEGHAQNTSINCLAFSLNGKYLASGGTDNSAIIWAILDGRLVCKVIVRDAVSALLWHPSKDNTLFVGCRNGTIYRCCNFQWVRASGCFVCIAYSHSTIQDTYDAKIVRLGVRGPVHCLSYNSEKDLLAFGVGNEVHSSRVDGKRDRACSTAARLIIKPCTLQISFPKLRSTLRPLSCRSKEGYIMMISAPAIFISTGREIGYSYLIFVMAYGM